MKIIDREDVKSETSKKLKQDDTLDVTWDINTPKQAPQKVVYEDADHVYTQGPNDILIKQDRFAYECSEAMNAKLQTKNNK